MINFPLCSENELLLRRLIPLISGIVRNSTYFRNSFSVHLRRSCIYKVNVKVLIGYIPN